MIYFLFKIRQYIQFCNYGIRHVNLSISLHITMGVIGEYSSKLYLRFLVSFGMNWFTVL